MIDFGAFRAEDGTPIYLQIIKYLKQGVVSGAVADGDELPSRRVLSALLGLNRTRCRRPAGCWRRRACWSRTPGRRAACA